MDYTKHAAERLPTDERQVLAKPLLSRKRQIDSDISDSNDTNGTPQLKRARLTRENLAHFTKMGKGKKESKKSSSSRRDPTSGSQKTKTTSTTTSGFADQARKNGILPPLRSEPPANLEDLQKRYAKSRETASPTEAKFKSYVKDVGKAGNEATMVIETSSYLLKKYEDDQGYNRSFDRAFSAFPDNVGFNDSLSAPQPDFVEGLEIAEYDPVPVDHVRGGVLYKDDPYSTVLSHIAGEWKGGGKNMEEARLQSAYDGASLVYARNQALSYMERSDPPGHAQVTTFTTDGTTLNQYAHYAEESEAGTTKYHQYRIKSTNLIDSHDNFKDGRRSLRNAQDHARDQSYAMRDDLKDYWKQQRSINALQPMHKDPQTSPYQQASYRADTQETIQHDEDNYEVIVDEHYSKPRSSTKHSSSKHSIDGQSSSKHSSSRSSHQAPINDGHKRKASQPSPPGSKHAIKHASTDG